MKKMRRLFSLRTAGLILIIMLCTLPLASCKKITEYRETKQREERHKQEQTSKKTQEMLNEMSCRKEAVLLAIKYKIDEGKVFNLLADTQSASLENLQATIEGKSITKDRLISLAEKYNIPIEIVASLLIDYYSMQTYQE